jgi:hypothetical protein
MAADQDPTGAPADADRPSGREWLEGFAARLGLDPPDDATIETLLDLAGVAAHSSERIAAPIACYLIGRAGADPAAVLADLTT